MKQTIQAIAIIFVAACALSARAQGTNDGNDRGTPAGSYNGGGLRGVSAQATGDWLVTPAEAIQYQGEEGFNAPRTPRTRAIGGPLIDIVKPEPAADFKVKAPFAIAVQFKGLSDAPIDATSFKVMYGAFKLDITNRITKYVKVTKDGFTLENAQIPTGKHRLILQVQDEKQRMAERELRVEVE